MGRRFLMIGKPLAGRCCVWRLALFTVAGVEVWVTASLACVPNGVIRRVSRRVVHTYATEQKAHQHQPL